MRKWLECDAAIPIQKQARVFLAINEGGRMREAEMKSRSRFVAHVNGNKIQAFLKDFSEARYGCPLTKDSVEGMIPLATEKMSFFESNPATNEATSRPAASTNDGTNTIAYSIQQEDFWRTQRVMLRHRHR